MELHAAQKIYCAVCLKPRPGEWCEAFRSHRAQAGDGRDGQAEIKASADLPVSIFFSERKRGKRKNSERIAR